MKRHILAFTLLSLAGVAAKAAVIVNPHAYSSIAYGSSWDTPPQNVDQVLSGLSGDITLTLKNGFVGETETWLGTGASSVIIEENAGFAPKTTFGWYNTANSSTGQLHSGSDSDGASASVLFSPAITFGFYIDPDGVTANRLYTQHSRNPSSHYQVVIFAIDQLPGEYIIGWEDLTLTKENDGDYNDLLLRVKITPVPEPGSIALLLAGAVALFGLRTLARRRTAAARA